MKIKELIEALKQYDPDMDVGYWYDACNVRMTKEKICKFPGWFWGESGKDKREILWLHK
jgi:hypothetical protein